MKLLLLGFGGLIILVIVLSLIGGIVLNARYDNRPEAAEFANGQFPAPALEGNYKGNQFTGLGKNWLGKNFNARENKGINNFSSETAGKTEQRYPFATSKATGLRNTDLDVLQLDYNQPGNPFWLQFIKDELVQTAPGEYLGKIHVKVGPLVVMLGYFRLSQ